MDAAYELYLWGVGGGRAGGEQAPNHGRRPKLAAEPVRGSEPKANRGRPRGILHLRSLAPLAIAPVD
jgi:hypothetical protein